MKVDIKDHLALTRWCELALTSRERQANVFRIQFGPDSAAVAAITAEIGQIKELIMNLNQPQK
jgi:hypothetical protein